MNSTEEERREQDQFVPEAQSGTPGHERTEPGEGEMACPVCGHPMPDLRGGKATICPVCGFKDSCCF
jgi:rubrerythrin